MDLATPPPDDDRPHDRMQRLLHRWFVQYNPIYLVSALLVLGGASLAARGLGREGSVYGPLGVALVAEIYGAALIAGAALLTRIGQRRPGVLLAMITVVYQGDLTLHTETCAYLGAVGIFASVAWVAIFVAKLRALAWAVKIRTSPRATATAILGAVVLAGAPFTLQFLDSRDAGLLVALAVFALGSLRPRSDEHVTSAAPLDEWGRAVLRRSVAVTWSIWGVLFGLHVLFWASQRPIDVYFAVPAFLFLPLVRVRRESRLWLAIAALLAFMLFATPSAFALSAFFAAITLARRAFSRAIAPTSVASQPPSPYRAAEREPRDEGAREEAARVVTALVAIDAATRARLLSGAIFSLYLSIWGSAYHGGAFPAHVVALDLAFAAAMLALAWRLRTRVAFVPIALTAAHALLASGRIPAPHSLVAWGALGVVLGFLLLLGSLATSYRLRHHVAPKVE